MIDSQHRELIAATNEIGEAIESGNGTNAIKKLLVFLKFYAEWHFGNEETCAAKHSCPMAGVNQEAHKNSLRRLANSTINIVKVMPVRRLL